ncbi:uncharacterized protein LTR77_002451 [Saxophila tyrrhenica]|uniref:Glycogen debranching enzyme n=1 Tax=Saxophila tyrrhenica TaxID=1690608 RepID=A0AAV9PLQ4_9PEZI|nr:hypothetical protein LTR77_002451 [Saxophila tyrrhenica]
MYSCSNDQLVYPPTASGSSAPSSSSSSAVLAVSGCSEKPTTLHLSSSPYENYFYSDCHSASQLVVTSPQPESDLEIIVPRLLVAWAAGDSGLLAFFAPKNGVNGSLSIEVLNDTSDEPLSGVYEQPSNGSSSGNPVVGISTLVHFNSSAVLTVPILGSIRMMRDFVEGPSLLYPEIQDPIRFASTQDNGARLSRRWLDNQTTTEMTFRPRSGGASAKVGNRTVDLEAGTYEFTATFDYPQLGQLSASEVLDSESQDLIITNTDQTKSLSFLSYTDKLLAGAWRFLTYFGRDSMITLLLMQPVLSQGEGGAVEAVIGAVLERINKTEGTVCHEETIGDYATYQNLQMNISSTDPICSYIMIDSNYYLPIVMENYFLKTATGRNRKEAFFAQESTLDFGNQGLSYEELALRNAEEVVRSAAAFAAEGGQTKQNLVHLEPDQVVGEWRDSEFGIGGGRIPYDVNTALVPAALRSIAALSEAGFFPEHPDWATTAAEYAEVWEDNSLHFFEQTVPQAEAKSLVQSYASDAGYGFPSQADEITSDVVYHGLALNGNNGQEVVKVMNSDDSFRLFMLNTTNQEQLTSFLNQSATNIRTPFPAGLSTPVGVLVANPAYGGQQVYAANWTNDAYHGTVVWGWPLAMLGAGLQRQLQRCSSSAHPDFCSDDSVYTNVLAAYNHLWDLIDANREHLSLEVWSWQYRDGGFDFVDFGSLTPTESDIVQLWSLTFLAITRDESLR